MRRFVISTLLLVACFAAVSAKVGVTKKNGAGTLTAYYANCNFGDYVKGQLIVDTNDPLNRMVKLNATQYKYEGDDTGEYYSKKIPKKNVTVKTFTMDELPVSSVGDGLVFVADNGNKARIFKANNNGHSFYSYDSNFNAYKDASATSKLNGCYVLSVELNSENVFEEQLEVNNGHFVFYVKNRFGDSGVRRRVGRIGLIEEQWRNKDGYPPEKSAYDKDGKLLVDQYSTVGEIADYISIAYIGSLNALYVGGTLFYKK